MSRSELNLNHAFNSVALIRDVQTELNSVGNNPTAASQKFGSLIGRLDEILAQSPDTHVSAEWHIVVAGMRVLASQSACVEIAQGGEGDLVAERAKYEVLLEQLFRLLSSDSATLPIRADSIRQSLLQTRLANPDDLRLFLLNVPLSALYWRTENSGFPCQDATGGPKATTNSMLRVIVSLDRAPIATPQLLKPNLLYPLVFRIRGLLWPVGAVRLRLDLLTTCPQSEFAVSEFTLTDPILFENDEYEGVLSGHIKFNSGQSGLLDDLVFAVRGAFETTEGNFTEISVIGHNELRLRVVDEDRHPLMTGNRRLDRHIVELAEKLQSEFPQVHDEFPDLSEVLQALSRLLSTYAQEAVYKGQSDVPESQFQKTVLRDLRFLLGQDVQEHPNQAGGTTDIRYRGVIIELKVEKENGDREFISKKYAKQPTRYAGVEARQISVLLVLDLTPKDKPPGDIRNDIVLTDVETHGGSDAAKEFPSKAFVFVINGNTKNPSDYSG